MWQINSIFIHLYLFSVVCTPIDNDDLKTPTRAWKRTRCIMQKSNLYDTDFPFKTFATSLNMQKQQEKHVWEKSDEE